MRAAEISMAQARFQDAQGDADPLVLAYLAGVVDSDGFITLHKSTRKGVGYYAAKIGITGTRSQPHDLAASIWGGKVACHLPRNPRHRPQYQWSRTGDLAYAAIAQIVEHLRVKRDIADLVMEAQELVLLGRAEDPYPWMHAGYDPKPRLEELRNQVVYEMNQGRRIAWSGRSEEEPDA